MQATDQPSNPQRKALNASAESKPVLVDHHPPEINQLRFSNRTLQGVARDNPGPIASLEYAVDGGEWELFFPNDELLDSPEEQFTLNFPHLAPGSHIVAIRAGDSAGNTTSAEITITIAGNKTTSNARPASR